LVVRDVDTLKRYLNEGYYLIYSSKLGRFYVKNPKTRRAEVVDKSLNDIAREYYEERKMSRGSRLEGVNGIVEETKFLISQIRQRLDPKLPIMTKFVTDTSWWLHLRLDFTRLILPELFSLMRADEIDIENPETTARNMASKVLALKAEATRARELEDKLKALTGEFEARLKEEVSKVEARYTRELEVLKEKIKEYEGLMAEYEAVLRGLTDILILLGDRTGKTLKLISSFIAGLPEDVREEYYIMVAPRIRRIWGGGG